jgi:four helix bundle protein
MDNIRSFRELTVWQKSVDFTEPIYALTRAFPKEELYGLVSQMRRAAVSIPTNIAEGHGRNSRGEFLYSLGVSRGSLAELETEIEVATRLQFLNTQQRENLLCQSDEIGRMLSGLIRSLRSNPS